jgi:hypothetical protein
MSRLIRVIEAATRDARRAEALISDANSRRALRIDPEGALLAFELRAGAIGDEAGEREARMVQRDRGVRGARRKALGQRLAARLRGRRSWSGSSSSSSHSRAL